jgi:hypothetical protein
MRQSHDLFEAGLNRREKDTKKEEEYRPNTVRDLKKRKTVKRKMVKRER